MPRPQGDVCDLPTGTASDERDELAARTVGRQQAGRGAAVSLHGRRLEAVDHAQSHDTTPLADDPDTPVRHGDTADAEAATLVGSQVGGVPTQHRATGHEDASEALGASGLPGLLSLQVETAQHGLPPQRDHALVPPRPQGLAVGSLGVRRRTAPVSRVSGWSLRCGQDQSDRCRRAEYQEHTNDQPHAAPRPTRRGFRAAVGGHPGQHQPTLPQSGSVACGLSTGHRYGSARYPQLGPNPGPCRR